MPPGESDEQPDGSLDWPASPNWPDSPDWMARGACQGADPELFFPISAVGSAVAEISAAKAVCRRCAVTADCLAYALATMPDGIWGGTTREERVARRRRSGAPQPRVS